MNHEDIPAWSDPCGPEEDRRLIRQHLLAHAGDYFTDLETRTLGVELTRSRHRSACSLYRFELRDGRRSHAVVVKRRVPRGSRRPLAGQRTRAPEVYRLLPEPDFHEKDALEHAALRAIQQHFQERGDPRFGAIRILDRIPELHAIVMEEASDPSLSRLFLQRDFVRRPHPGCPLSLPFANAGAWLRLFHTLPVHRPGCELRGDLGALEGSLERLGEFLARTSTGEPGLRRAVEVAVRAARVVLPVRLPLVPAHGDYGPNNILVHSTGRVMVFDTCAKWRVPFYEDLAFFLFTFETIWPRAYGQRLAWSRRAVAHHAQDFLHGYFGEEAIPWPAIRVFELQCVLSHWASRRYGMHGSSGVIRAGKRLRMVFLERFFRRYVHEIVQALDGG